MATIYKNGDKKQILCTVDGTVAISKGDLLYLSGGIAYPFSNLSDSGSKLQNQRAALSVFLGIAGRAKAADGTTTNLPVFTGGVFEFAATSATYNVGDLVGPQGTGSGGLVGVHNTALEAVASANAAIGKVVKKATTATRIQVRLLPVMLEAQNDLFTLVGSGGTVTQITSSATAVTLNKLVGAITTVSLTTAAGAEEEFVCNNELVGANDIVILTGKYGGAGTLMAGVKNVASGSFNIVLTNVHAANAFNSTATLNFIVLKGATS